MIMENTALDAEKKLFVSVRELLNALNAVGGVLIRRMVKMAEMTAMEFLKEYRRMCEMHDSYCSGCPISKFKNYTCRIVLKDHPEEVIAMVQEWADEHPKKTMLQDFFEKYPNAPRRTSGEPLVCPESLGYRPEDTGCHAGCDECWNRPLEE